MAHTSLGYGLWAIGEWENAEREYEWAIESSPGYAAAHHWYSLLLWSTGRASEGVSYAERATQLDPVSAVMARNLGRNLAAAGRAEEAVERSARQSNLIRSGVVPPGMHFFISFLNSENTTKDWKCT